MQKAVVSGAALISIGAILGAIGGIWFSKTKYEAIANAEIESVRKFYAEKMAEKKKEEGVKDDDIPDEYYDKIEEPQPVHILPDKPDIAEMAKKAQEIVNGEKYVPEEEDDIEVIEPIIEKVERNKDKNLEIPYVISPAEFGDNDYEEIELTYYADGVLTEGKHVLDDPDDILGPEALESFGEYEEDAVYVRNDARRCDYVVLKDLRKFTDLPRGSRR